MLSDINFIPNVHSGTAKKLEKCFSFLAIFTQMPSLVSVQILAAIVCFCCISYFIIIVYPPVSFQNIAMIFTKGNQSVIVQTTTISTTTTTTTTTTVKFNYTTESYICDAVNRNSSHNTTSSLSFQLHRFNALRR